VHLCSALLERGPTVLGEIEGGLRDWLEEREYESVRQLQGSVSERNAPNPAAFARANYLQLTRSTWSASDAADAATVP
jgi:dihydroorotate dehydrogenase (fumarate)